MERRSAALMREISPIIIYFVILPAALTPPEIFTAEASIIEGDNRMNQEYGNALKEAEFHFPYRFFRKFIDIPNM